MNVLGAALIVVFGFLFSVVSARITGLVGSSSCPLSGMTIAVVIGSCLIFLAVGWTGSSYSYLALVVARGRLHRDLERGDHGAGPQDGLPRRLDAALPAGRHPRRRPDVRARDRLDDLGAERLGDEGHAARRSGRRCPPPRSRPPRTRRARTGRRYAFVKVERGRRRRARGRQLSRGPRDRHRRVPPRGRHRKPELPRSAGEPDGRAHLGPPRPEAAVGPRSHRRRDRRLHRAPDRALAHVRGRRLPAALHDDADLHRRPRAQVRRPKVRPRARRRERERRDAPLVRPHRRRRARGRRSSRSCTSPSSGSGSTRSSTCR